MTDIDPAARARGYALRQSRLARANSIRRRIIGGAVALFVACWLFIAILLVTGRDPVLSKQASVVTVASAPAARTITTSSSGSTSAATGASSSGSSSSGTSSGTSSGVSSVTTSQS